MFFFTSTPFFLLFSLNWVLHVSRYWQILKFLFASINSSCLLPYLNTLAMHRKQDCNWWFLLSKSVRLKRNKIQSTISTNYKVVVAICFVYCKSIIKCCRLFSMNGLIDYLFRLFIDLIDWTWVLSILWFAKKKFSFWFNWASRLTFFFLQNIDQRFCTIGQLFPVFQMYI